MAGRIGFLGASLLTTMALATAFTALFPSVPQTALWLSVAALVLLLLRTMIHFEIDVVLAALLALGWLVAFLAFTGGSALIPAGLMAIAMYLTKTGVMPRPLLLDLTPLQGSVNDFIVNLITFLALGCLVVYAASLLKLVAWTLQASVIVGVALYAVFAVINARKR